MYELHHIKGNTYYIDGRTNLGLYKLNATDVVLIDVPMRSGGPAIETLLRRNNLKLKYIVNTHSHPDHCGANQYLIKQTGCQVIASRIERAFMRNNKLDIGFLSGGYPLDHYDSSLMHVDEQHDILSFKNLPSGLRTFKLPGHHYDMCGIKTKDGVYFIADSICTEKLINKEHIMLIYDVAGYKKSLHLLETLKGKGHIFVPSHAEITDDLTNLITINLNKILEIEQVLVEMLKSPKSYDEIISRIFTHYNLKISYNKYLLIGSTIRSYLAYLVHQKRVVCNFEENILYFAVNNEERY